MLKVDDIIYDDKKREYKIIKPIGRGGMGYVLLVERLSDKQQFAVKTLSIFIEGDSDHKALLNEGKLAEGIKHQNVIQYEYFHDGETYKSLPPYIIMELADENNLQDLINDHTKSNDLFDQNDLVNFYFMLIDGMEAINTVLVHRDIKPSNILFKDGELKISDFGIAKVAGDPTRSKSFKGSGTIPFFPPEAFLNKENTIQMDIYSMGIVFYLLATLKNPYEITGEKKNDDEWKNAHLYEVPAPLQNLNKTISPKLATIIQKMIEKNPSKRFSSWEEIRVEMKSIGKLEESKHSDIIQKMIEKKLEKRTKENQVELEETRRHEDKNQKDKMIIYQFSNDIIKPIEDFIKEYNSVNNAPEDKITIIEIGRNAPPKKESEYRIRTSNFTEFEISIHIIEEDDYLRRETRDMWGDTCTKTIEPLLNNKKVLAWGMIKNNIGKGFNLVLIKSDTSDYGDWFILNNTHSALAPNTDGRPDPFPFDLYEIKEEIQHVTSMHIYDTQVSPFIPQKIIDFISEI